MKKSRYTEEQNVVTPFDGRAFKNNYRYGGVDVLGDNGYKARILYVTPSQAVIDARASGLRVNAGDSIGTAIDIRGTIYPANITNHVHFQLQHSGRWIDPTPFMFGR